LRTALEQRAAQLTAKGFADAAASVNAILGNLAEHHANLEDLEMRLGAIEEKILAQARAAQSEEQLLEARRALESELKPHRGRLSAAEISMLEKSFLDRELFARLGLDRLSLFFLL